MTWGKSILKLSEQVPITIKYGQTTHLPMLHVYKIIYRTTDSLSITRFVTIEYNQNPAHLENFLLQWHFKLGHTGFYKFQWIGRQFWMGKLGEKMGSNNVNIPKCAACQYGKQERNPKYGTSQSKDK